MRLHTLINMRLKTMMAYLEQTDNILYQKCGFPYKDLLIAVTDNCIHVLIFVPSIIAIIRNDY